MNKYEILLRILDRLREEAPATYKRYHPAEGDAEGLIQARSRALIHLYLKVQFGLIDFTERERVVTDGKGDGGIDGYFIDREAKIIYLIQSKFRATEENFRSKELEYDDLLKMDADRITQGFEESESGEEYSGKIKQLIREIKQTPGIGSYKYKVIILANLKPIPKGKLKKLTGDFDSDFISYERIYKELVFPVIEGTFFNPSELSVSINLSDKEASSARITYRVKISNRTCKIWVLFVPTIEIAKTLSKYRNSILMHNPRSYLGLAHNPVNKAIEATVKDLTTNEFALYNNGITMLSYGTEFSDKTGEVDRAALVITRPQIINGGQTAFTLSRLYERLDDKRRQAVFADKEVMLKVITLRTEGEDDKTDDLVRAISKATNQQTNIEPADRRANEKIQVLIRDAIYDRYGYFYERKLGEYADGLEAGYIDKSQIIDRELFIRICNCCDYKPAEAKRFKFLFEETNFKKTLNDASRYQEYFFAYKCYERLNSYPKGKKDQSTLEKYGNAIDHGIFAVVSACRLNYKDESSLQQLETIINDVLAKWKKFEAYAQRRPDNKIYIKSQFDVKSKTLKQFFDFGLYYKGQTLNEDLLSYFNR